MSHGFDEFKNMIEMYSKAEADLLLADKANTASPTFTGTPKAPTPANTTNNMQLATTAFVRNLLNVVYPVGITILRESVPSPTGPNPTSYTDAIGDWTWQTVTLTIQGGMSPYEETYKICTRVS